MPTAQPMTVPTSVMQPGRPQLANPTPGTNPAAGIGAGNTWAYTDDQGQMFNEPPPAPVGNPLVRTLANGQMNVVGGGTTQPQPNMGQGFGVLAPGQAFKDPMFSAFTQPKGSKTRPMTEEDVSHEGVKKRRNAATEKYNQAYRRQSAAEQEDPRLNDIRQGALLYFLAQRGRNPLQDAMAGRRAGINQLGL